MYTLNYFLGFDIIFEGPKFSNTSTFHQSKLTLLGNYVRILGGHVAPYTCWYFYVILNDVYLKKKVLNRFRKYVFASPSLYIVKGRKWPINVILSVIWFLVNSCLIGNRITSSFSLKKVNITVVFLIVGVTKFYFIKNVYTIYGMHYQRQKLFVDFIVTLRISNF